MEIDTKKDGPYTETGGGGVSDAHILIIPDWIYLSTALSYPAPILKMSMESTDHKNNLQPP